MATPVTGADAVDLEAFISHCVPGIRGLRLDALERLPGGLSRESWAFRVRWQAPGGEQDLALIMRRDPSGSLLDTDRRLEFAVLRALESTPVAAPAVYWIDEDGSALGSPSLIMERVDGRCEWYVLRSARPEETRVAIARQFLDLLVEIQRVDWRGLGLGDVLKDPGPEAALVELRLWEEKLRRVQLEPVPELDLVLRWLRERARPAVATVLVHGDFKPGNALLVGDRVSAMLDWETAHLGDPLEDLGWVTNPVRAGEHQIPGRWERQQIVEAYTAATGRAVDDEALVWWNVFSCWKLAVIVLTGLSEFVSGRFDRVHHSPTWLVRAMLRLTRLEAG